MQGWNKIKELISAAILSSFAKRWNFLFQSTKSLFYSFRISLSYFRTISDNDNLYKG